jgi:cytochrome P450
MLRDSHPFSFHPEPDLPGAPPGPGYWAVLRHQDILEISRRPDDFSSAAGALAINDLPASLNEFYGSMISLDDPRHARLRRIVSRAFTPKMVGDTFNQIEARACAAVRSVADHGDFDFVNDLAARFPLAVICDLIGVPESQHGFVLTQSNIILSWGDREYVPKGTDPTTALLDAGAALSGLMAELAELRRRRPVDDLASALVHATIAGERLTDQEIVSFFILLLVAGHETTRNALCHGLMALDRHPDQRQIWRSDVLGVGATAVEEVVRYSSPITFMRRTATRDTLVGGHRFLAGEKVLLFYGSANRDETVFTNPESFDVRRHPNPHLSFGAPGPHFCLGAHLARREIDVMFREIFAHLPEIEVTAAPDLLRSQFVNGLRRLPVRVDPSSVNRSHPAPVITP